MFDVFQVWSLWADAVTERAESFSLRGAAIVLGTRRDGVSRVRFIPAGIKHSVAAVKRRRYCSCPSMYNATFNKEQCCTFYISRRINKVWSNLIWSFKQKMWTNQEGTKNVMNNDCTCIQNKMIERLFDSVLKLNLKSLKHWDPALAWERAPQQDTPDFDFTSESFFVALRFGSLTCWGTLSGLF